MAIPHMSPSYLPYVEIMVGIVLLVACYFLFAPLKAHAAAHGNKKQGKVFHIDEVLLVGWMILASVGIGLVVYGLTG
jgi:hypothetical protein